GQITAASTDNAGPAYFFDVKGMHCAACAATLRSELVKLDGVTGVLVDYDSKTARVNVNADADLGAAERRIADGVAEAATRLGYSATLRSQK
ncbi:MAG: heavy metal-associated domain-containing protein, partial [Phycisphaerales bacterium]